MKDHEISGCRKLLMDTQTTLERLKYLAECHTDIEVMWLYGSRALGQEHSDSDFDLAIAFRTVAGDSLERQTRCDHLKFEWADELQVPDQTLSIVDINGVPIPLGMAVVEKGYVVHSKSALREAREENRIASMWELDHEYYRRKFG
jgi:predicted nucleotidyltransferase